MTLQLMCGLPTPAMNQEADSCNEWTETGYLEPDNVYGYGYLEAIKKIIMEKLT